MKRSYKTAAKLIALILVIALPFSLFACSSDIPEEKVITVIAKGESHAFWQSVKSGAEAAGEKYGYKIEFHGPQSESKDYLDDQKAMVKDAIEKETNALVLATIGEGFADYVKSAAEKGIPVIEFDSGLWPDDVKKLSELQENPVKASVATSNKLAGAIAAQKLFEAVKADIENADDEYEIGIIQHDESQTGVERAKGFETKFLELANADAKTKDKVDFEIEVGHDNGGSYAEALEELYDDGVDAIFMTNEGVVKQVYDEVKAADGKYDKIKFFGFDSGSKQLEWMRQATGARLVGSVAQDSFQIGFNAVEQAVFAIENKDNKDVELQGVWWNVDNVDQMLADSLVYEGS